MNELTFVDTNVLVYCRDADERDKQPGAQAWLEALWRFRTGRVSIQVLAEYYVTVTRKLDPGLSVDRARADVATLRAWRPAALDYGALEAAWTIQNRHRLSWWDALIVAAAQRLGCRYLLSEDFQDRQRFEELEVINPFLHAPEKILGLP
ncbi:tRNA(fMet)-specific endonuclease VapC [Candidatus Methylomirabilis lanthanidiphila]|uniref:Ribonuclease VapC n=1 Tax=Candidatus Methylomirabilis lanthanidiphila TaxID=2211376 RepID=A0A564ZJV1_9BACT|nr:PIN domain-containing protein [Candidatus Methylomirabilis lanthanidiphila]VUZ84912.1 tRNA(fMet)-specific endonuclease VapC [Candidatus Methylomirabilis lanthanidiphila]